MLEKNLIFNCLPSSGGSPIFASRVPIEDINLTSVRAATVQEVDAYLNYFGTEGDSANQTFTQGTMQVPLANGTITGVPRTYTYQISNPTSQTFDLGLLIDWAPGYSSHLLVTTDQYRNCTQ